MSAGILSSESEMRTNEPILLRETSGPVCTLTLNRPDQYNALSEALLDELQAAFDVIAEDKSIRVVERQRADWPDPL